MIEDMHKKCIEVDIDATLYYTDNEYSILEYNKNLIDIINILYDKGVSVVIRTGRNWGLFNMTIEQLKKAGVKYHSLIMGKPTCDYYIDDKGIRPEEFVDKFKDIS